VKHCAWILDQSKCSHFVIKSHYISRLWLKKLVFCSHRCTRCRCWPHVVYRLTRHRCSLQLSTCACICCLIIKVLALVILTCCPLYLWHIFEVSYKHVLQLHPERCNMSLTEETTNTKHTHKQSEAQWLSTLPCPTFSRWTPPESRLIWWSPGELQVESRWTIWSQWTPPII